MYRFMHFFAAVMMVLLVIRTAAADDADRKLADFEKRRAEIVDQRERILSKMGLAKAPERELRNLAGQQKKELEAARDDCRKTQDAAIGSLAASAFRSLIADQTRQAKSKLQRQAQERRQMIAQNNERIEKNAAVAKEYEGKLRRDFTWQATLESAAKTSPSGADPLTKGQLQEERARRAEYERIVHQATRENESLAQRNAAAQRVCNAIENVTQSGAGAGQIAEAMATLRDASLQEKNTWDKHLTNWERENDFARRVAAELFLGMDPAIATSNNPEMILAELSPVFNEKLMRDRAEMYDLMAKGVDEALNRLLAQAAEYRAALPQLEAQLKELDAQLDSLDDAVAQARAEIIVPQLPKGMVNEEVLQRWVRDSPTLAGYPVDGRLVQAVVREMRKVRQERLQHIGALMAGLAGKQVGLSCVPESPVTWLPGSKKVDVVVTVSDDGMAQTRADLRDLVRRLTGVLPQVTVTDHWTFQDQTFTTDGGETSEHLFTFDKPETYVVQVARRVEISVKLPPRHICPPEVAAAVTQHAELKPGRIKIEVKPAEAPTEISGRWFGQMSVQTLIIEGGQGQQGCDLSSKLAGKAFSLTLDIQGPVAAGRAVMQAKSPGGEGGDAVAQLEYQTTGTAFTARGAYQGGTMTLNGRFTADAEGWSLGGSWSWTGVAGQNKGRANGGWSVAPPKAIKPR